MMTIKKGFSERRKHERFKVKNGAIAMIRPLNAPVTTQKYCQIINISKGGLAYRYIIRNGESNEPFKLDVLFIQDSICSVYLKDVSSKTVWVSHIDSKTSFNRVTIKKRGVQFGEMMSNQMSQLDRYLKKCTIR
ncbi:MAG: PilZ domain-containing protein [Desulfobacterales bacterium]|jgi:hypothetical protein